MNRILLRGLGVVSMLAVWGCDKSLDIQNPNEPDNQRLLADPVAVEAVAGGSMRTWFNAWTPLRGATTMNAQARTHSASWNNGNMRFYTSMYTATGAGWPPNDTGTSPLLWTRNGASWQNNPSAAARTSIDALWGGGLDESGTSRPGMYAVLSAANDALKVIRRTAAPIVINDAAQTKRAETVAQLMQGAGLMAIALTFDKGYYVDENSDLTTLAYISRKAMRDSAISKLNAAYTMATANTFTTPASWANGVSYTNVQIAKIAKTMVAMTLAYYARDNTEAAAVDWTAVAAAAALGMSSGAATVDFTFVGDGCAAWCHEQGNWMSSMDTGRLSTRVAYLLDPAGQKDPYPLTGNPRPNSADKRLGDGSFGDASLVAGFGTTPKTAAGGTDFAWSSDAIFRPDRGYYHQSNIAWIRWDVSGVQSPTGVYGAYGTNTVVNAALNDLLWAEAALRLGGAANITLAVGKINNSRVTRGGLAAAAAGDALGAPADGPCTSAGFLAKDNTTCTVWSKLLYENEIELLGLGPVPFFNQRHLPNVQSTGFTGTKARFIQGLIPGTPREMPVPYKELAVKGEALYTWGGTGTANSVTPP